jgi:hypothetical protein
MTKPDNPPCKAGTPKAGSPMSIGALAFFVLLGERLKSNPGFLPADLHAELAGVSKQFEDAKRKSKEKK